MGDMEEYGQEQDPYGQEGEMDNSGQYGQEEGQEYGDENVSYKSSNNIQGEHQEGEEEEEINFDEQPEFQGLPPLDKMRKVRRDITQTINDIRSKFGNNHISGDILTNRAANEYAEYLLLNEENPELLKQICEKNNIVGEHKVIQGIAHLEEDIISKDPTKKEEFMDAHGLLLELQDELG